MWLDVALFCNLAGGLLTFQYFAIIWKLRAGSKRVAGVSPEASGKHKWHKRAIRNVPDASSIDAGILTSIALWSLKHDFFASKCKLEINILSLVILRRAKFRSSGEKNARKGKQGTVSSYLQIVDIWGQRLIQTVESQLSLYFTLHKLFSTILAQETLVETEFHGRCLSTCRLHFAWNALCSVTLSHAVTKLQNCISRSNHQK